MIKINVKNDRTSGHPGDAECKNLNEPIFMKNDISYTDYLISEAIPILESMVEIYQYQVKYHFNIFNIF